MTRFYIVTLELLSSSNNGCFPESCLMISSKIEKVMIKLVAGWTFINIAPLKFQLTFRTTLFSVIHTDCSYGARLKESFDLRTQTRSVGELMVMIFLVKNSQYSISCECFYLLSDRLMSLSRLLSDH